MLVLPLSMFTLTLLPVVNPCIVAVTFAGTFKAAMLVPRICGRYNNVSAGRHAAGHRQSPTQSSFRLQPCQVCHCPGIVEIKARYQRIAGIDAVGAAKRDSGGRSEPVLNMTFAPLAVTVLVGAFAAMLFVP